MNALIRKEVRQILPSWVMAMVLATLPVWILRPGQENIFLASPGLMVFAPFGVGVLLLSLTPFGQELNWGTFSVLLSQPVSRRQLWLVKTIVLALALGLVFVALCISNYARMDSMLETMKHSVWRNAFNRLGQDNQFFLKAIADTRRRVFQDTLVTGGLAVLAGFAGGLWTTLLFRQVTAAFWVTCLVPLGLSLLTGQVLGTFPDAVVQGGLFLVLGAYSVAGFVWAKRLFQRVQDVQWTGGVISLPRWGEGAVERTSVAEGRNRKPTRALLGKEFQAQHVNLLLAGGLLLLHLGVVAFRKLGFDYLATHRSLGMSLEAFPVLWLAMPLLVGSVAIAEERKLGTLESCLCLPTTRRLQLVAKLALAMLLGVLFGGVMPLVVEQLAGALGVGVRANAAGLYFLGDSRSLLMFQLFSSAGLTGLAFWGSTLTRNTLQAVGAGLMAGVVACLVIIAAEHAGDFNEFIPWRGPLIGYIGWPVMVLTLVVLASRNYRRLQPDLKTWGRNGLTFLALLICVGGVTTMIYHRVWEAWLPEEPMHSLFPLLYANARGQVMDLSPGPTLKGAKLQASGSRTAVVLPNGRLWLSQRQGKLREWKFVSPGVVTWYETGPLHTGFVGGSNWKDVAVTDTACFGIRADGSLWDLSKVQPGAAAGEDSPRGFLGNGGWQSISAGWGHFCAVKSDGTLWEWGEYDDPFARSWSVKQVPAPVQVGNDTDWVAVCNSRAISAAMKEDGSIWRWGWASKTHRTPERWLMGPCSQPRSMAMTDRAVAAVCADGTLWLGGDITNVSWARLIAPEQAHRAAMEMVRWGNDSDWSQVQFAGWGEAVGVKRDGSLWEWDLHRGYGIWGGWVIPPTMPSLYMDWVAVYPDDNAFIALARDGSLCLWGDPRDYGYSEWNGPDPSRLLMPSRIKARRIADLSR